MPLQHSPPARHTRAQASLTTTPRAPLDGTPAVPQLRAQLDRGPIMEGRKRAQNIKFCLRSKGEEEEENSAEKEDSDFTEGVPDSVATSQGTGGPTLAQYNQPVPHKSEP
ncbi:hypothetical protein O181_007710 [Austropuccinia psidii MF-1]|uniref:Uncharacterized protein n=1 Tax=Austropuccinia psidii MF-1 TaxID=1389203 RepID=A0A9Q3GI64_9BASI|nr:hypothetical protein [Austropuccinia psidii MF-1]